MIRELTKSALSFSWALSLLGVKQAVNLGRPGQQNGNGDLFAPVTQIAVGQLDESMKGIYRSGDHLGSRAVDLAFCWLNPLNWLNPSSWTDLGNWANPANWTDPNKWMNSIRNITNSATGCCGQGAGNGHGTSTSTPGNSSSAAAGGNATVGSESAAVGWGPMPVNQ